MSQRHRPFTRHRAAHVNVLNEADVNEEPILDLQTAEGAVVAQHRSHQTQPHLDRHQCAIMEAGQIRREQSRQAVTIYRRLKTEVDHDQPWFTNGEAGNPALLREARYAASTGPWSLRGLSIPTYRPCSSRSAGLYLLT